MINYFSKNKYNLKDPSYSYSQKSLQECKNLTLQNKKAGFEFTGNNNKCLLYSSNIPNNKLDKDILNDFSISKYIKSKNEKDASFYQQTNPNFYFNKVNHYNFDNKNKLKSFNVQNLNQCQKKCLNNSNCKSIYYFQQPQQCTLYNSIQFGKFNKSSLKDIYNVNYNQLNKNINHNYNQEEEEEKKKKNNKHIKKIIKDKKKFLSKYKTSF